MRLGAVVGELNNQTIIGLIAVAAAAIVLALTGYNMVRTVRRERRAIDQQRARELAVMVEEVSMTAGGVLCLLLLIGTVLLSVGGYAAAKTVFQQIEAGVSLMSGCIIFGLGVALGRRRTFRIYRSEQREDWPAGPQ